MPCAQCNPERRSGLAALSRAAAKYAQSRWRAAQGEGVAGEAGERLRARLAVCGSCRLRVLVDGVPHCGRPLWARGRSELTDPKAGCGCPLPAKASDPEEHCPLQAGPAGEACACRWCVAGRAVSVR